VRRLLLIAFGVLVLAAPGTANASSFIRYGVQDDAWLSYGPGTLEDRLQQVDDLGVDVVRVTINWREVEPTRGADNWGRYDELLDGLHAHGIAPLVTLYGTPRWANGGRSENWAPRSKWTFAAFARTAASRYPFVHLWTIWNEPNQRRWLRPTSARVYTQTLLNVGYAAIHNASPHAKVAGGVTAPRASAGGVSPLAWIAGMKAAHAKLDAYAHNPYPLAPGETPSSGGCGHCTTITMATLPRLLSSVQHAFGTRVRIWLTEYGYQTNPPDRLLGVSYAKQASYVAEAAQRAYAAPRVDVLIHYLVRDEPDAARWQSGLFTTRGLPKPSYDAFRFPLTELARSGSVVTLWGQVRPGARSHYRLQVFRGGAWRAVGGTFATTTRGYYTRRLVAARGSKVRIWSVEAEAHSPTVTLT
jgi:hypothetical protein